MNTIAIEHENNEPLKECIDLCHEIERLMSRFKSNSDISRINRSDGKETLVDDMTVDIIQKSILLNEVTYGSFDISVGAVSSLWQFTSDQCDVPSQWQLDEKSKYIDSKKISVKENRISIAKGMKIDLGGIAKGYAADQVTEILKKHHIKKGYINLGGNIKVIGSGEKGKGFRVGIQSPFDLSSICGILKLENKFVSTSGIYERCFTYNHVDYHHILDTDTGLPVQNSLASVSLVTSNGTLGDALSTACMCMGFETSLNFVKGYTQDKIEVLFIFRDGKVYWHGEPEHFVFQTAERSEHKSKYESTIAR